ncbi:PASTA domain-containing protein [Actinophytocola xanthii]|uniref:PASTA domain-containing protein n=1 Tax=Actinophytocola xanthii TaxID=1912961 RepID=A0A1Q8CAH0_9PSEU|nr:PASTA domain-containing protein [Actinophytocola xanthii]OLF11364.1 hypothetical protein BU204_30395 [Actinophytocola xanthii]
MRVVVAALTAVVLAGCEGVAPTETTTSPPDPEAAPWTMPDVVGSTLQEAQDEIQRLTGGQLLVTDSHDATGQDRAQVLDGDWIVCTQNVAPGTRITTDTRIDFGAVKAEETCP